MIPYSTPVFDMVPLAGADVGYCLDMAAAQTALDEIKLAMAGL